MWELTEQKAAAFDALLQRAIEGGGLIDYDSPCPKYELLCYLAERGDLLLHGSNRSDIAEFEPRPNNDYLGRPLQAVYACSDGIWPLYFAITNRAPGRKVSMWNACVRMAGEWHPPRKAYFFSLNRAAMGDEPWTDGTVYLLPRTPFTRVTDAEGNQLEEWASRAPVRSLALLRVSPEDFPFRDQVIGHEGKDVVRYNELVGKILQCSPETVELPEGYSLQMPYTDELLAAANEYADLLRKYSPYVQARITSPDNRGIDLQLTGPLGTKDLLRHLWF